MQTDRLCARALVPALVALAAALTAGCSTGPPGSYRPSYKGAKIVALSEIRFDDGDTFEIGGRPIRVLGIDTPEIAHPDLGVNEAQPFGPEAAESTRVWLTRARLIEIVYDGRDMYNRRLAHVFIDGELLACRLIRDGLAYETVSHYGDSGFPDLAQLILDTSRESPKPMFEPPYQWKRKHRPKYPQTRSAR
jgi:endonuclease YncB( thermonuclease family)